MQSPGPGPQDPDAETRRVDRTPAGSRPDAGYPGGYEPDDDAERTRLVGENPAGYQPGHPGGWPPVGQPPTSMGAGFPPAAAGRPLNDPYGRGDPRNRDDPYGREDRYGHGDPHRREDPYGEDAQTRILPDGAGGAYPSGSSGGQNRNPGADEYPPTTVYPPAGGYGPGPGAGGPSGPDSDGYGGSPGYQPLGYPPPGGYLQPGADYGQGYQQQGYQHGYPGPDDYQQQGYQQQGYQQQGYPAPDGYQQGYPPAWAYGAGPPPGSGPGGGPPPAGSGRRRMIIIGATVVAVLLLIVIPIVLLTGGSDDGKPVATVSTSPSASPVASATPSTTPTSSPSPSPSASAELTPAENALLAKLDSSAMTDCKPNSDVEGDHILASLFCNSDDGKVVAAYAYATAGDLTSDIGVRKSRVTAPNGKCKEGGSEIFTWNFDQSKTQGTAVCTERQNGHFIFWSYDDKLVSFMATGTDGVALYEWWSGFDPVPQS
ncbi:hypothetical protein [Frankia sp. QA3]|uniref:hypothetical protein n=1 Tax=Frankia sp. QA3 TaxID=710111 RepID=UPI000269C671|nr:hypothetical protein [Frankia sp. QA3]EIV94004.1 hypothetical protein FraQA3DRAFT_3734 [Frankia sp. QA3]